MGRPMKPADFVQEFFYPVTHLAPFMTILTLGLLSVLALNAGFLGIWLAIVVFPATIRYQLQVLEARARGIDAEAPGIESFSFVGQVWTLFPIVHYALAIAMIWFAADLAGKTGLFVAILLAGVLQPAALAVLVLTRSPLESINPLTIARLIGRVWTAYWVIPVAILLSWYLQAQLIELPFWLMVVAMYFLSFSMYSVIGGMIRPFNLHEEVEIEPPVERDYEKVVTDLETSRTGVLSHAYGFASRGNVAGALDHVTGWLSRDEPFPGDGWPWFFEAMLRWDDSFPALKLAQQYLDVLLVAGEDQAAAKLMLRCKHVDEAFRPNPASMERALEAARTSGNSDVETWLRRR